MNLTIDIGNTRTKICVFEHGECLLTTDAGESLENAVADICRSHPIDACAVACVGQEPEHLNHFLKTHVPFVMRVDGETPGPLQNAYSSPHTLGADRWAAAVAAASLKPYSDLLVIDAGTCITYDLISAKGVFLGGNISPGITMRFHALNEHTARLPELNAEGAPPRWGTDTASAIRAGVLRGVQHEMEGFINEFIEIYPWLLIFLTGGSSFCFPERLKSRIFAQPNLVSMGLDVLLRHHRKG